MCFTTHCALEFASNCGATLYAIGERLLVSLCSDKKIDNRVLNGLVGGMVENLRECRIPNALTDSLTRGDASTVMAHVDGLRDFVRDVADLYVRLTVQNVPMLEGRGLKTDWIDGVLAGSEQDEE